MNTEHMETCSGCGAKVHPLAVFPAKPGTSGIRCLTCYTPDGERMARQMTAQDLTRMWGGK